MSEFYTHVMVRLAEGEEEYDLDTMLFDMLPRIGDTILFTQAEGLGKPQIGTASCRVIDVWHDVRVGSKRPVHPIMIVQPLTPLSADILSKLYPEEEVE